MTYRTFDLARLLRPLRALPVRSRAAFAAACAERLAPAYAAWRRRTGRVDASQEILDRLWAGERPIVECSALIPGDDEPFLDERPYAVHAMSALACAVRAFEDLAEAVRAAEHARAAAAHHVSHRLGLGDAAVSSHIVVQAELARQERDLEDLAANGELARLRERAREDAAAFFEDSSAPGTLPRAVARPRRSRA